MDGLPPLALMLKCIPAANRRRLDEKLEDRSSLARIAKSIRNWKTLAQFLPNIHNDIDGIECDNRTLELQQIALLDKWLERNGPWATYRKLAECLYEAGAIETLQVLCSELGGNLQQAPAAAASNVAPNSPPSTHQSLNPHYDGVHDMEPTYTLPETKETAANTIVIGCDERELNPLSSPVTVTESQQVTNLEREIKGLHRRFHSIKELTINCLEKCRITVMTVVYLLTSILGVGEHKKFLEDKHKVLRKSEDHLELFGQLNFYWNYLSFDLLDELIDELIEKNSEFKETKKEMEKYKEEMKRFRESTTLVLFCRVERNMLTITHVEAVPPPGFQKMVTEHQWPETVTLKDVEEFRKSFLHRFQLPECALMVYKIQRKCFEVTWFGTLPAQLLVESREMIKVFIEFKVVSVEIGGECVYQAPTQPLQPLSLPASGSVVTDVSPETHQELDYESSLSDFSAASLSGFADSERLQKIAAPKKMPMTAAANRLIVQCHESKTAQRQMDRGSAITNSGFVYFAPCGITSIYQMESGSDNWKTLCSCPYRNSALAVIDNEVTAVGGWCRFFTKKLLTLRRRKWVEVYPPLITARSSPAVVCTSNGQHLIVIGGLGRGDCWTTAVEILQVKTRTWYKLNNLPQPLHYPSATICSNQLYVIGDCTNGYSCNLQALLSYTSPLTAEHLISWTPLPPLPVSVSTAATLCGQLVIVGGVRDGSLIDSIYQLLDRQWVEIGHMTRSRSWCLVASPFPNKIIIVGGQGALNVVEECIVSYQYL